VAAFFFTGCGGGWLKGKWTLDRELTLSKISAPAESGSSPGDGFLKDLVGGLQKGISRLLLTQFEGVEIEFTPTEYRRVRHGVGESVTYRVIERPDASTVVVQYGGGEIVTWNRVQTGVRMKLPGDAGQWVYFRRLP